MQPLLATELVFMLLLRRFWIHQSIRAVTWVAAAVTCVGLTVFVVAGQPGGGRPTPAGKHWFTAGLACCACAGNPGGRGAVGVPERAAPLYGSASAVMWALVATFIKATTDTLTEFGVGGMLTMARLCPGGGKCGGPFLMRRRCTSGRCGPLGPPHSIVDPSSASP